MTVQLDTIVRFRAHRLANEQHWLWPASCADLVAANRVKEAGKCNHDLQ